MDKQQEAFYRELLADLKIEAAEHRDVFTKNLIALEQAEGKDVQHLTEVMFREMHSLKGAARAVNLIEIESLCQATESVMSQIKNKQLQITPQLLDIFHEVVDLLDVLLRNIGQTLQDDTSYKLSSLLKRLNLIVDGDTEKKKKGFSFKDLAGKMSKDKGLSSEDVKDESFKEEVRPPQKKEETPSALNSELLPKHEKEETVRISTERLGKILRQAEELILAKAMLQDEFRKLDELRELHLEQAKHHDSFFKDQTKKNSRVDAGMLEAYSSQQQKNYARIQKEFRALGTGSQIKSRSISRMIDDLLIDIRTTLLVPFTSFTDMLPKTVRDLSKSLGKSVILKVSGSTIEIDRRILEEIKDPIIHLIRNCIDHGIESAEKRLENSKPAQAELKLSISQTEDRRVTIQISDDGAGIDATKVSDSAVKNGLINTDLAGKLNHSERLNLIFRSGVSTSKEVTTMSGRGLGMAIVAEKVEGLGGKVMIDSTLGKGTSFTISLPLTLTTFRGVMVRCCDQHFMVNTMVVERVMRIDHSDLKMINDREAIVVDGENVGLVSLGETLNITKPDVNRGMLQHLSVLLVNVAQKRLAFVVDEIKGEHEGIVKDLGPLLQNVKNISGAVVLGDGKVVPVVNTRHLLNNGEKASFYKYKIEQKDSATRGRKKVLVAEDSLTSRSLLRNILEVSGYEVKTAVDGAQAYEFLCKESFDLLVSDIEMPNLNGIELVKKVRVSEGLKSLPVMLITSLDTPEDKQRGLEAGADAYFVKSSFDQTNMVEIVKQLI